MVKYFLLKGHEGKFIHKEFLSTLEDNAISLSTVKNWLRMFKSSDLSCGDKERPGRPLICLGPALHRFLKKFPFTSTRIRTGHFSVDLNILKSILDRELELRKFTHRWVSLILSTGPFRQRPVHLTKLSI
jgi:transposase